MKSKEMIIEEHIKKAMKPYYNSCHNKEVFNRIKGKQFIVLSPRYTGVFHFYKTLLNKEGKK